MARYLLVSTARALLTVIAVSILVFSLARLTGSPLDALTDEEMTERQREAVAEKWGLNRPLPEQYLTFMANAVRGDFGVSFKFESQGATGVILERFPRTLQLGAFGLILTVLVGIPMGVLSAVRRGSWLDRIARTIALLGQSVPEFWLGIVLIWVFAVVLGWLPTSGRSGPESLVLPGITLAVFGIAALLRLLRSSMLDTLGAEYIKLARAKGLSEARIVWKHALKNAAIGPLTYFGRIIVHLLVGATVIEVVFSWPGLGLLAYEAANARDFPVMQALALIGCVAVVGMNLVIDVLYGAVDPRIRLGQRSTR